ncbi:MAG: thiamine phosphate synthase [Campylobacterota bacterium]|nr:thiamine phosphate synthase [Campylobacterota bacterium]
MITDPKEYGDDIATFKKNLSYSLSKHNVDMVCFRDKQSLDIKELAKTCLEVSKQFNISKVLINTNIDLAVSLGFDGVHLTSNQFDKIKTSKEKSLYTIISTHTKDEVNMAKQNGANGVTYSPIFYKENKGEPKGIENLTNIVNTYQDDDFSIIALGGIIKQKHINKIKTTKASGFASIRYFTN